MVHVYNGILPSHKEEGNIAIWDNVNGPGGSYAKWNESDRERQVSYAVTYMWDMKTDRQAHRQRTDW